MENCAPQTQYLGHVFIDVIFRFSLCSLYVRTGPFLVMPYVAALKLTPDSTEALFWLDGLQMLIPCLLLYDFPNGTDLVSFREAWHPCVNVGGGWDTWNLPSSMWTGVSVPSPTVCHIPTTFNLPFLSLFVCLTPGLACSFVTSPMLLPVSSSPSMIRFLTNHKVFIGLTQAKLITFEFNSLRFNIIVPTNQPLNNVEDLPVKSKNLSLTDQI